MSEGSGAVPGSRDHRDLGGRVLDMLLYGPVGVVVTVAEHGPELAERGRSQLGSRIASAHAVGELAVRFGRDELRRRAGHLLGSSGGRSGRPDPAGGPPGRFRSVGGGDGRGDGHQNGQRSDGTQGGPVAWAGPSRRTPPVTSLGIPGFDTLSASQVVQRLDGLSRSELVAVRAYEGGGRGRRTVLNRIDQLMDERA